MKTSFKKFVDAARPGAVLLYNGRWFYLVLEQGKPIQSWTRNGLSAVSLLVFHWGFPGSKFGFPSTTTHVTIPVEHYDPASSRVVIPASP